MGGILGTILGESPADAAARVEEAKKTATDLTGMVRKKAKPVHDTSPNGKSTNGKRKAEDDVEESESKKVKFVEPNTTEVEDVANE